MKKRIVYSDKEHTQKGIFSFILSVIVLLSLILSILISYWKKGQTPASFGAVGFLCTLFSGVGIVLALFGRQEPEKFYLFANIGLILNIFDLLFISTILYAGI
ncbi:MAG: DUF6142 family protein [Lachnospiraceae bacterium]|nr:DUF6142 family protein [Lachnospiraceae bacterium]